MIAYVAPSSWRVPELGFAGTDSGESAGGGGELLHPTTHGNPLSYDENSLTVLLADVRTDRVDVDGMERFTRALNVRPLEFIELNVAGGEITERRPAGETDWAGIPVPTF